MIHKYKYTRKHKHHSYIYFLFLLGSRSHTHFYPHLITNKNTCTSAITKFTAKLYRECVKNEKIFKTHFLITNLKKINKL